MRTFARRSSMFALAGDLAIGAVACGDDADEGADIDVTEEDTTAPAVTDEDTVTEEETTTEETTETELLTETETEMTTPSDTETATE